MANTPSISPRQERIQELERSIIDKRDTLQLEWFVWELKQNWIPDEEFSGITTFRELHARFKDHGNEGYLITYDRLINKHMKESRNAPQTTTEKVLKNIRDTRQSQARLLWDINSDPAYQMLELLQSEIWEHPGALEEYDEGTIELWKEWAANRVAGWQTSLQSREALPDMPWWEDEKSSMSMEQQYQLLFQMHASTQEVRDEIVKRLCMILPSAPGSPWRWEEVQEICDETISPANV